MVNDKRKVVLVGTGMVGIRMSAMSWFLST